MNSQRPFLMAIALLCFTALPFSLPRAGAAPKPLVLVVARSVPLSDISTSTLRRVFQGMPTAYSSGKRFVPLNHPTGTPTRTQFDRAVLGLEPGAVGAYWIDRRIRDESPPPRTIPTAELAQRIAASLPGAITYVYDEDVSAAVKMLTVDGRSPGQPGYPL